MIWVKICGITNLDDALMAVDAGADALGFVLEPSSPRFVEHQELERWLHRVPRHVRTVAVFGDFIGSSVIDLFDTVQAFRPPVFGVQRKIEARRVQPWDVAANLAPTPEVAEAILLDAHVDGQAGGTGNTIDWQIAHDVVLAAQVPVILAGGLTPENVREAVLRVRPYGVDVSTGVQSEPRKKDPHKVREFVRTAKRP